MAYTPYEWTVNSYVNPTRMNAIEQGIALQNKKDGYEDVITGQSIENIANALIQTCELFTVYRFKGTNIMGTPLKNTNSCILEVQVFDKNNRAYRVSVEDLTDNSVYEIVYKNGSFGSWENVTIKKINNDLTTLNSKLTKLDTIYTSQIINPVNKGFIALNRPNGATGGKVVKLIPLGTAAISKEISIQVGISGNTPYSYFALDDTTFNTIKGYNTVVAVEWTF